MKPSNFFKKLSEKINVLEPERKKEIFTKSNLEVLKLISEYCEKDEKVIVLTDKKQMVEFRKVLEEFNFSIYYSRRGWAVFLTNFNGKRFTKIKDDRYRFLQRLYPNCKEYKELLKKRNQFFKDVLK